MKTNDYLVKIEKGLPINFERFLSKLRLNDPYIWPSIYSVEKVDKGHVVKVIDQLKHKSFYEQDIDNRSSAAKVGRSHSIGTSFSHLLMLSKYSNEFEPKVVVFSDRGVINGSLEVNNSAVIIENIENFYLFQDFMNNIGHGILLESCDFIFGAGKQITNKLHIPLLTQYENIYCAGDLDFGGLQIYQTLKKTLPQTQWLSPKCWEQFEDYFQMKPKSPKVWLKTIELAEKMSLHEEASLLTKHKAFLEQEALLP